MRIRGRTNRHSVNSGIGKQFAIIRGGLGDVELPGHFFRGSAGNVRERSDTSTWNSRGEILRVNATDAATTDDTNVQSSIGHGKWSSASPAFAGTGSAGILAGEFLAQQNAGKMPALPVAARLISRAVFIE